MRWREIVQETSSAGSTAAGNIAAVPGGIGTVRGVIGAGFDSNGDYGIYPKPSKKKSKKRNSSS